MFQDLEVLEIDSHVRKVDGDSIYPKFPVAVIGCKK